MGSTLSKAKQIHLKTSQSKVTSDSAKVEVTDIPRQAKKTKYRKHQVGSVSVKKRTKPKYKKVTKSIIGKPTNFKHTNHMGAGDLLESSVDMAALSNELHGIAKQVNCFQEKWHQRSPPAPPPHKYISSSVKKRAAKASVPISFRRRQYRKAVPQHHPNLGLVNALMIEIPTLRPAP